MPGKMKKLLLISAFTLTGLLIATCGRVGPDAPPDLVPPTVSFTVPGPGAEQVPVNIGAITATFSEEMDQSTINSENIWLKLGEGLVNGSVSYSNMTAVFKPNGNLNADSIYTLVIAIGVKDLAGNALPQPFICTFVTGTFMDRTPPKVSSTTPARDATGVAANSSISIVFTEPMLQSTLTAAFSLSGPDGPAVPVISSCNDTSATFTPGEPLRYDTVYTATIGKGAQDLASNALEADYSWTFKTGSVPDTTAPFVIGLIPPGGAANVPITTSVSITFSEAMDSSSLTTRTITVSTQDGAAIAGTVTPGNATATFKPLQALAYNTVYVVTITTGVKDLAGNPPATEYVRSFTTGIAPDTVPPRVIKTMPSDKAIVGVNTPVTATFSEAVKDSTITAATFFASANGAAVPGVVDYAGTTAIFTPASLLQYGTTYTITITTGVQDLSGNPLAGNVIWTFTTVPLPDTTPPSVVSVIPDSGGNGVPIGAAVTATFSEPVDQNTLRFTLSGGGADVPCTMSYSGATSAFTPKDLLAYGTTFTGTVSAGVKDLAGNMMPNDYSWSFTTEPLPPLPTYTIVTSAGINGRIEPASPSVTEGSSQTFMIIPDTGYLTVDVAVDGLSLGPVPSYTFDNVTAGHSITAGFAAITPGSP